MPRATYSTGRSVASRTPARAPRASGAYSGRYSYPTSGTAARQRQEHDVSRMRPSIDVVGGRREETIRENNAVLRVGAAVVMLLLAVTIACFVRIALTNATVSVELDSQALSTELSESRSAASALEVQETVLSNSSRIKTSATELKMAEPTTVDEIYLTDDVVVTNADGSLSFSESVKRATSGVSEG